MRENLTRRFPLVLLALSLVSLVFAAAAVAAPDIASDRSVPVVQELGLEEPAEAPGVDPVAAVANASIFGETPIVFASYSSCIQQCTDACDVAFDACVGGCGAPGSPGYFQCYFQCEQDADFCYDCCYTVHC